MATYTINTGPRQEAVIARVLAKLNQQRALAGQPALTLPQLAQRLFNDNLDGYTRQDDDETAISMFNAFNASSPSVQANVKAQLGLT